MTKICTTIEQSKKLIELGLSQETADMSYIETPINEFRLMAYNYKETVVLRDLRGSDAVVYPCWSLSALLKLMPTTIFTSRIASHLEIIRGDNVWHIHYIVKAGTTPVIKCFFNAPDLLDAAYDTMYWLLENKKL